MKSKLIIISVILLFGCTTIKKVETKGLSIVDKSILFENDTIAKLSNIEYSLDNGKFVREMTFKLTDMNHGDKVKNIIYFMHKEHKGWDIEVDFPIENVKLENK